MNHQPVGSLRDLHRKTGFPVVIATHPRSGTHLTIDLLRRNFDELSSYKLPLTPLDSLYVALDVFFLSSASPASRRRAIKALARHPNPIVKTHWMDVEYQRLHGQYDCIGHWLKERARTIYVIRNPENVLSSTFLFEQGYKNISGRSAKAEWLLRKAANWVQHVKRWSNTQGILVLRFEDIVNETDQQLKLIGDFLGLPVNGCSLRLPPRMNGKWGGRISRLRSNPPTTEILNQQGRKSLEQLFDISVITDCRAVIAETAQSYGYNIQSSPGI